MDGTLMLPYATRGFNTAIASYSLRGADDIPRHIVLLGERVGGQNHADGDPIIHWRLLEKCGEDFTWCLTAFGDRVEGLMNVPTGIPIRNKFGMPGSGFPRCSDGGDPMNGSLGRELINAQPQTDTCQLHEPQIVSRKFVVASSDASAVLDGVEKPLDSIARTI
jgi:hypothetical protein